MLNAALANVSAQNNRINLAINEPLGAFVQVFNSILHPNRA
jgi:hypothetical protein